MKELEPFSPAAISVPSETANRRSGVSGRVSGSHILVWCGSTT